MRSQLLRNIDRTMLIASSRPCVGTIPTPQRRQSCQHDHRQQVVTDRKTSRREGEVIEQQDQLCAQIKQGQEQQKKGEPSFSFLA